MRCDPVVHTWGTTSEERAAAFPCDTLLRAPDISSSENLLPIGDLVMMRKQLLTLKRVVEDTGGR